MREEAETILTDCNADPRNEWDRLMKKHPHENISRSMSWTGTFSPVAASWISAADRGNIKMNLQSSRNRSGWHGMTMHCGFVRTGIPDA